jgi:hypothetical protein
MKQNGVFIPEVVHSDPWTGDPNPHLRSGCPAACPGCRGSCPGFGQTESTDLALEVDATGLVDQMNAWFGQESPFFGLSWGSAAALGLAAYVVLAPRMKLPR